MTQFQETKTLFSSALNAENCNTSCYWEWMLVPDNLKAVALYTQFYNQITLAWSKTKKPFVEEETAISTLMQYLIKNVSIIEDKPERYREAYIYQVARNSFYSLGVVKREIAEYANRASIYERVDKTSPSLDSMEEPYYTEDSYIDRRVDTVSLFDSIENRHFWEQIEKLDADTKDVVECLINHKRITGALAKKKHAIIKELRVMLMEFYFCE